MSAAVLSVGSNLGDRLAALQSAIEAVRPWLVRVSGVYETAPWGPVEQGDFLNAVVLVDDPAGDAPAWLRRAQAAERAAGRTRELHWGPRTLDVDVITVCVDGEEVVSAGAELVLPHPRAAERAFVLVPWASVSPDATLGARTLIELVGALPADERAGVRLRPDLRVG